jgi:DHA2 family multidrug resistance protein
MEEAQAYFLQLTGDAKGSEEMATEALATLREQQASSLSYFDVFWLAAMLGFGMVILVFLMKRSVAEKGAHIGGE